MLVLAVVVLAFAIRRMLSMPNPYPIGPAAVALGLIVGGGVIILLIPAEKRWRHGGGHKAGDRPRWQSWLIGGGVAASSILLSIGGPLIHVGFLSFISGIIGASVPALLSIYRNPP